MNRVQKLILTCILVVPVLSVCLSQNYSVTHFNESKGFNASTVYNIIQDNDGFIWVGSNAGLIRYDGVNFKKFTTDDGLEDNDIFGINVDKQNHIYLHNYSNKANYYYQGELINAKKNSQLKDLSFNEIPIANYNKQSNSFILSSLRSNFFYYVQLDKGKIKNKEKIELDEDQFISQVISIEDCFYLFYSDTNERRYYKIYKGPSEIYSGDLNIEGGYMTTYKNRLCVALNKSLYFYKKDKDYTLVFDYKKEMDFTTKVLCSNDKNLWVSVKEGGVLKLNSNGKFDHLLKNQNVNHSFTDSDSNLWIGTEGDGLYYLKKNEITNFGIKELKYSKNVMSLASGIGNIVYLGFNKLAIAKYSNDTIINQISLENKEKPDSRRVLKIISLGDDSIICLTDDYIMKVNTNKEKTKKIEFGTESSGSLKDLIITKDCYFIGASGGLDKEGKKGRKILFQKRVISLELDEDSTLWIGTLYGLFYKKINGKSLEYKSNNLKNRKINDILIKNKVLFLATDSGICAIKNGETQFITKSNGLSSNLCNKLSLFKNELWIATGEGISKININSIHSDVEIETYGTSDGLASNFINDILVKNDTVWAATVEGLSVFPSKLRKSIKPPKINIIWAKSNLTELNIYAPLILKPDNNNISIAFSGMSFINYNKIIYEYRLSPTINKWTKTKENSITFSELAPNNYTFEVRSLNKGALMNNKISTLKFEITPAFFQTWWFKLLIILLVCSIILLLFYWRVRAIRKKENINKMVSQLELEAIKAQINPHFIYNCLNSIKSTILKNENLRAEEQLSVFAKLVRQTLTISQLNFISLNKEIDYLKNYLEMEKMRFKDKLEYSIMSNKVNKDKEFHVPPMLIQPFVENAIKHGSPENENIPSKIMLEFIEEDNSIICNVIDNGKGISNKIAKQKKEHKSLGMSISSSRAEKYNKLYNTKIKISINSIRNQGTTVKITIPQN